MQSLWIKHCTSKKFYSAGPFEFHQEPCVILAGLEQGENIDGLSDLLV